ncbi:LacI family DNA-binding transcriptional regulator [Alkalibacterium kapii]|uniref:Ribose operon repressor n=1 Tax=Alkalibacterium kapii TaxID=426704 RepID=A0A511ATN7_9LACT|nr:LacI family DNA-binding transcriptional regulator [Alkalibacterium kapii]GEK90441.1 ribose operon repressor [Alkalibacterium kapii]
MATIKEVAKYAGVSVATVSRALNKNGYVSEAAQKKVEEAIKALDYFPNEVARSLYQKRSKMIGLLLPDISNPYFPLLMKGIEENARENGYSVILGNVEEGSKLKQDYMTLFGQQNVAGVLSAVEGTVSQNHSMPIVMLDRVLEEDDYAVYTNDVKGGILAAQAIMDRKPGNVLIIAGPKSVPGSIDRLIGILSVLNPTDVNYEIHQTRSFTIEEAKETAEVIFRKYKKIDSVLASNDLFALAVMKEAQTRGLHIPNDIQVIGYDDIPFSQLVYPGLTTISQPAFKLGYQASDLLIRLINKNKISKKRIKLDPKLMIRDSLRKK